MPATKLYNPLDDFNSYSIHYVMLASRTTEDARAFVDPDKNTETLAAIEKVHWLGEAIPYGQNKDTAYLIMDTRRFSQFTIEKLKYEVLINGLSKGQSTANFGSTLEMTILDSVGISFINFIQWLMDEKMQCNFDGMVYMLRVIFIGHKPDGSTDGTTVQTVTIPMHLLKLELNLDHAKGVYNAEFMPNVNFDAKSNSRWLNIGMATQYKATNNKLGDLINSFEQQLNTRSKEFYDNATSLIKANKAKQGKPVTNDKFGRLVQYSITIPTEWNNFELAARAVSNATETIFGKEQPAAKGGTPAKAGTPGKPNDSNVAVDASILITDALDRIFKLVPEIATLGNGTRSQGEGGSVQFYKYLVGMSSDNDTIIVHVDVLPFKVPNVIADQKTVAQGDNEFYSAPLKDGTRLPKQYAEFDYIFTGKNTQVLEFDMKLQDLTWLLSTNLEMGPGIMSEQTRLGQDGKKVPINTSSELVNARPYDAILMPKNSKDELENFSAYASLVTQGQSGQEILKGRQKYTQNLSKFYAISPINAMLKIKGNPLIMQKFSVSNFLDHRSATSALGAGVGQVSKTNLEAKAQYRKDLNERIIKDNTTDNKVEEVAVEKGVVVVKSLGNSTYTTSPVFVKVNIKGPNVDFQTSEMVPGQEFSTSILYDNFYVVFKVVNYIENGIFWQELELFSHNIFGNGKLSFPVTKAVSAA